MTDAMQAYSQFLYCGQPVGVNFHLRLAIHTQDHALITIGA
jgi:hypothetical protein